MPVKSCRDQGSPGYKWGDSGKCYIYKSGDGESREEAKRKAEEQGAAVHASEEDDDE